MGDYLCPKCHNLGIRAGRNAYCVVCEKRIRKERYHSPDARASRAAFTQRRNADPVRRAEHLNRKKEQSQRRYLAGKVANRKLIRLRAATRESERQIDPRSKVYFVQDSDRGLIKIGFTTKEMRGRLKELQCGNPFSLVCLAVMAGTRLGEKLLHDRFELHRLRGEWFHPAPELLDYIASLTAIAAAA